MLRLGSGSRLPFKLEQGFSNLTLKGPDVTFIGGRGSTMIGNDVTSLTCHFLGTSSTRIQLSLLVDRIFFIFFYYLIKSEKKKKVKKEECNYRCRPVYFNQEKLVSYSVLNDLRGHSYTDVLSL